MSKTQTVLVLVNETNAVQVKKFAGYIESREAARHLKIIDGRSLQEGEVKQSIDWFFELLGIGVSHPSRDKVESEIQEEIHKEGQEWTKIARGLDQIGLNELEDGEVPKDIGAIYTFILD
jgi:hypothetical protein